MHVYLLGRGIRHALAPALWNGVFGQAGVNAHYGLIDVDADGLDDALKRLHEPGVLGYNVTTPYQAWAAEQGAVKSPDVERAGASNWICERDGRFEVANTDVEGARLLLDEIPTGDLVLLLGAGATAAAILVALQRRADRVVVANRTHERAVRLVRRASAWLPTVTAVAWDDRMVEAARATLIINATPLGMRDELSPLGRMRPRRDARIYDAVHRGRPTRLQRQAAAWGLPLADGLAHLEAQAIGLIPYLGLAPDDAGLVRSSLRAAAGHEPYRWVVPDRRRPGDPG